MVCAKTIFVILEENVIYYFYIMAQTITISKSFFDELLIRLERLEKVVFKKNGILNSIRTYKDEKQKGELKKLKNVDELFT
jgi:hypothetical protein